MYLCIVYSKLECPKFHVNFGGSCYFPSFLDKDAEEDKTWNEARDYCQQILPHNEWRYDLISIQTKEELDFMLHFDWSEKYKEWKEESSIWIGLNNLEDMANWQWSDESEVMYPTDDTLEIHALPWMKKQTEYDQTVRLFHSYVYAQLFNSKCKFRKAISHLSYFKKGTVCSYNWPFRNICGFLHFCKKEVHM